MKAPLVLQVIYFGSFDATASTTLVGTINSVKKGSTLLNVVTWEPAAALSNVRDDRVYTALPEGLINDATNNQSAQCFRLDSATEGTHVVTTTFAGACAFLKGCLIEIEGSNLGLSVDVDQGQHQQNPGTGADVVTSTASASTTTADDLILGVAVRTGGARTVDATAGTGFTLRGSADSSKVFSIEDKTVAALGTQTATFTIATDGATADVTTFVIAVRPPSDPVLFANRPSPALTADAEDDGFGIFSVSAWGRAGVGSWVDSWLVPAAGGGGAITLSADAATFTVSAAPATLAAARNINAAPAAYTYTAQAAQLIVGRAIIASAAAYTVAASDLTMLRTYTLVASPAAYALTAFDATLSAARSLSADPAAYSVTAQAATLSADRVLSADPAAYTYTAFDAELAESGGAGLSLDAQPAAYAVTAFDTGLAATRAINAAAAAYTLAAQAATLAAARNVNAAPASYVLTAADAGLAATKAINAGAAAYTLTAADAELLTGGGADVLTSTDLANITAIVDARVDELQKIWINKMTTDPATGLLTIFDDDNTTPIWQGPIYEDVAGTQPYRDKGADRRDKLT